MKLTSIGSKLIGFWATSNNTALKKRLQCVCPWSDCLFDPNFRSIFLDCSNLISMLEAMFACHGTKTNGHLWRHTSKLAGDERKPPMWTHMPNTWLFGSWIPAAGRFKEFIEAFHSFRKWPKRNFYRVPLTKGQLRILCPQLDSYAKPERKMEETCETGLVAHSWRTYTMGKWMMSIQHALLACQ